MPPYLLQLHLTYMTSTDNLPDLSSFTPLSVVVAVIVVVFAVIEHSFHMMQAEVIASFHLGSQVVLKDVQL